MIRTVFDRLVLIDTSAAIALHDPGERYHLEVRKCFTRADGLAWGVLDLTSHECFSRVRYAQGWRPAMEHYAFLRESGFHLLRFDPSDEPVALGLLNRYSDKAFSFHDVLCAAAMLRIGIYRILTIDRDFADLGFETLPVGLVH